MLAKQTNTNLEFERREGISRGERFAMRVVFTIASRLTPFAELPHEAKYPTVAAYENALGMR